ncbi:hypothetical protein, partial [Terrabacter sp. 2RAF25]|uniref:hypothetical protein n=1 Tax=Terrabacter sp. 2RAF25 TaxID=3232998 RepID=UPI003F984B55
MFTRELALGGLMAMACTLAHAQEADPAPNAAAPRTVAALPQPVGDFEEPTPPSPLLDTPET